LTKRREKKARRKRYSFPLLDLKEAIKEGGGEKVATHRISPKHGGRREM